MSRASKMTLLGSSLFALGTVVFVHFQQKYEQEVNMSPFLFLSPPLPLTARLSALDTENGTPA